MNSRLDHIFLALGDPTRRAMLQQLTKGHATVRELARSFPVSMQAVSKHLRVLERAGAIRKTKSGRERVVTLDTATLDVAGEWIDAISHYRD